MQCPASSPWGEGGVAVVCVGHVCVDMVNVCRRYPAEDAQVGSNTKDNRWGIRL